MVRSIVTRRTRVLRQIGRHVGRHVGLGILAAVLFGAVGPSAANAEDADAFYKAHKLTIGVPNAAGGGYDIYVRALARHIGRHMPGNPAIVVQNVPAAGGMALANQLYNTAFQHIGILSLEFHVDKLSRPLL